MLKWNNQKIIIIIKKALFVCFPSWAMLKSQGYSKMTGKVDYLQNQKKMV